MTKPNYIEARKRYARAGAVEIDRSDIGLFFYTFPYEGKFALVGFRKRQSKPFVYNAYPTEEARDRRMNDEIRTAEENKARYSGNRLEVGDILSYSWGWEQTNIDFYKVVAKTEASVKIARIASKTESEAGFMSRYVVPDADNVIGETITKRVKGDYVSMDYGIARKWEGRKVLETSYA